MHERIKNFFRLTDRIFGMDTAYIAHYGSWLISARMIGIVASFLLSLLYANLLTKELYGTFRFVTGTLSIFGFLTIPGLGRAFLKSALEGREGSYRRGIKIQMLASLIFIVVGLFLAAYFYFFKNNLVLALAFLVGGFASPLEEGTGGFLDWLSIKKRFKEKSIFTIVDNTFYLVSMGSIIWAIVHFHLGLLSSLLLLIGGYFISQGIPNIYYLYKTMKTMPSEEPPVPGTIRYGFHLTAGYVLSPLATYLDGFLLFTFLGPVELAIYSFAIAPGEQLKGLLQSLSPLAMPKLFRPELGKIDAGILKKVAKTTLVVLVGIIVYIILAPYFYEFFFRKYLSSVPLSQLFALSVLVVPASFLGETLQASGNVKKNYIYQMSNQIIQIIFLIILIPLFGLWGAIWARIIGRVTNIGVLMWLLRPRKNLPSA